MVWHRFFFTGRCRSIESEEHQLVMESDWQWRSRGLFAFCRFTFRYVKVNFSWKRPRWWFHFFFTPIRGRFPIWLIFFRWVETTNQIQYCLILVWNISLALQVADCTLSLPLPSCFHPMSEILGRSGPIAEQGKMKRTLERESNNTNVLQVSNINTTPWFHFPYMIFRNLEPQTFVPNTRLSPLHRRCNSMTSWCSSQSCWLSMLRQGPEDGQRWQTISSLRLYNAICAKNIYFTSTTKHLKPRSRVEVNVNELLTCLDVCRWSSSRSVLSIFEWTSEVILISIEANHNLSACQKETFILILIHPHPCQSFPTFMWKCILVRPQRNFGNPSRSSTTVASMTCTLVLMWRCQMQILKQYSPLSLAEEGRRHETTDYDYVFFFRWLLLRGTPRIPNHQLTISWYIFVDIFWGNPWLPGFCLIFTLDDFLEVGQHG